jgi:hypothetical protein
MESTVISDAVNRADRVEDLTKTFGCSIALTADTLEELPASMVVTVRSLGDLQLVRGKSLPVKVLELIDAGGGISGEPGGDASGEAAGAVGGKAAQPATLERFETGVEAFYAGPPQSRRCRSCACLSTRRPPGRRLRDRDQRLLR